MTDPLQRLTREVARTIGDGPGPVRRARQRAAVARLTRPRPAPARAAWWLLPLAAAVVALLLARGPATLTAPMTATVAEQAVMVGAWLAAPEHEALTIDFSDRSRAVLAARTAARLVRAEPGRVELNLERGVVTLFVHAVSGREWVVSAGPFVVALTDAEGLASWTPETRTLVVELHRGSATIGGDAQTGRVTAGQRLELRDVRAIAAATNAGSTGPSALSAAAEPPTADPSPTNPPTATAALSATNPPTASANPPYPTASARSSTAASAQPDLSARPRPAQPSWLALAEAGDHGGALAAAERLGFARLLRSLDVDDLDRLARSARFAGAGARAREALLALRERFPADRRARTAAFLLGRVALDLEHDPTRAGAWFSTYLSEAPDGPLAEEARRRLAELGPQK